MTFYQEISECFITEINVIIPVFQWQKWQEKWNDVPLDK